MPKHEYQINGRKVTKREFESARRDELKRFHHFRVSGGQRLDGTLISNLVRAVDRAQEDADNRLKRQNSTWPKVADIALGIDPENVPQAMERNKQHGLLGVTYNPEGDPVFSGPKAYQKYCAHFGLAQKGKCRSRYLGSPISADQLKAAEEMAKRM